MVKANTIDRRGRPLGRDTGFPFRDVLVVRTYEPLADMGARSVAHELAERLGDATVSRVEPSALERQARHAAFVVVGTPDRRRHACLPGRDASALARRLRVPVVVVPRQCDRIDLVGVQSIVCGVRDTSDAACAAAAGALADALDLQLVLVHVCEPTQPVAGAAVLMPPAAFAGATPDARASARELLGAVASQAGRTAPGAACPRVVEGPAGESLCAVGRDHRAALITVTASRRGPLAAALLGSTSRALISHADRPVLVCPRDVDPALRLASQNADSP